ncbi:MAG: CHAT domain-containing protein [Methanosarcinaceae archaeon]|nr:CHAT domain-containing protein [Methanosarcinaceae archaeon]MDD4496632.1 CHAT domain-containing protein [Methanosarcinaceae archaeon]
MSITEIAEYATKILAMCASKTNASYEVQEFCKTLYNKLGEDKDEQINEFLRLLEANPEEESLRAALAEFLIKKARGDQDFAKLLTQLVYKFHQDRGLSSLFPVSSRIVTDVSNVTKKDELPGNLSDIKYRCDYLFNLDYNKKEEVRSKAICTEMNSGNEPPDERGIPDELAVPAASPEGSKSRLEYYNPALHVSAASPEEPEKLVRYPNIECPDKVILDVKFSLLVQLLLKSPDPNATGIFIEDPGLPDQPPEVELVIFAKGFDIKGSNTRILKVDRDNDSDERFVLIPRKPGEQQIRVDFYQHGRRIGTERHNVLVTTEAVECELKQPESRALYLNSESEGNPPDLEICIQLDNDDKQTLNFVLHSTRQWVANPKTGKKTGYHHARFGEVSLKGGSPEKKIEAVYHEMSLMARKPETDAERRMAAIGNELWDELISDELKREYWRFKDHVKSVLITSDEPWIPWEMIKPYRYNDDSGEREDELFWCQKFDLSRWLSGPAPGSEFSRGIARPVAPVQVNLNAVRKEVSFIESLDKLNSGITCFASLNDKVQVLNFVEKETFTLLHFATHGGFDSTLPNDSSILLSGGNLRPSEIHTLFGVLRPRPLIFINACEGAQMGFSFTGLGGWADRLVNKSEVGAFAGAMWEVKDALALKFARSFYTALLQKNKTIAQAFRIAREAVRKAAPSNSTWLAYVLYADPEASVETVAMPPATGLFPEV